MKPSPKTTQQRAAKHYKTHFKALNPHQSLKARYRSPLKEGELQKRLALIPEDTRDLTGRQFGDPIVPIWLDPRRTS